MSKINLNELIKKTESEKAIEFFVEILNFVKDVKPILESMNSTIYEGVNKMPVASKKLAKVTEATEVATTEILNIIDGIYPKIDLIRKGNSTPDNLDSIEMDMSSIMMSLQVQDITSQQIAAVNHTLLTIQSKLNSLLQHFDTNYIKEILNIEISGYQTTTDVSDLHRKIAFDPEAIDSLTDLSNRQDSIDELINLAKTGQNIDDFSMPVKTNDGTNFEFKSDFSSNSEEEGDIDIDALFAAAETASNDDIDALFGDSSKASNDDIDALFGNSTNASNDDIDALFGSAHEKEELSADDINALFNK